MLAIYVILWMNFSNKFSHHYNHAYDKYIEKHDMETFNKTRLHLESNYFKTFLLLNLDYRLCNLFDSSVPLISAKLYNWLKLSRNTNKIVSIANTNIFYLSILIILLILFARIIRFEVKYRLNCLLMQGKINCMR